MYGNLQAKTEIFWKVQLDNDHFLLWNPTQMWKFDNFCQIMEELKSRKTGEEKLSENCKLIKLKSEKQK